MYNHDMTFGRLPLLCDRDDLTNETTHNFDIHFAMCKISRDTCTVCCESQPLHIQCMYMYMYVSLYLHSGGVEKYCVL